MGAILPSARTLDGYIDELATLQALIASVDLSNATRVFLQSDTGPDGSKAKILTWWDSADTTDMPDGSVKQFCAGLEVAGKKSADIAEGIAHMLTHTLALPNTFCFGGITSDSGGGTPES